MLLVDDLLAAPMKGILWVFKEIHKAATEEQRGRRDQIMADLSALYVSLEQGEITDEVFDDREQALLDELDTLDARGDADDDDDDDAEAGSTVTVVDDYPVVRNALVGTPEPALASHSTKSPIKLPIKKELAS